MRLRDYLHASIAVDTVALTYDINQGLLVLEVLQPNGKDWALPGTFLHEGEVLADAVQRSLKTKAGMYGLTPRQLQVFDALNRDKRDRVISVAHVSVVPPEELAARFPDKTRLAPVDKPGRLPYDHNEMIELAVEQLRTRYKRDPDPDHLLGDVFTLRQLRMVHLAVEGDDTDPVETFRRKMLRCLEPAGGVDTDGPGRPAQRFRRK
jgi:8-oxo-dGTP diphosphatase